MLGTQVYNHVEHRPQSSPLMVGKCGAQASRGHQLSPHSDHPPAAMLVPLGTGTCWAHRYNGGQGSYEAQASHSHQLSPDGGQVSCGAQVSRGHQLSPHPDHPPAATLVPLGTGTCWGTGTWARIIWSIASHGHQLSPVGSCGAQEPWALPWTIQGLVPLGTGTRYDGGQGSCRAQVSHGHQLSLDGGQGSCGAQASRGHQLSPHPDHPPAVMLVPLGTGTCSAHRYGGGQGSCGAQASCGHQPDHPLAAMLVPIDTFSSSRLLTSFP